MSLLMINPFRKKRTYQELNIFEKKKWNNIYKTKLKELHRLYGDNDIELYKLAKQHANRKLKIK